ATSATSSTTGRSRRASATASTRRRSASTKRTPNYADRADTYRYIDFIVEYLSSLWLPTDDAGNACESAYGTGWRGRAVRGARWLYQHERDAAGQCQRERLRGERGGRRPD